MATLRIDAPGWKPEKHNKKTCIGKRKTYKNVFYE